MSERIGTEEVCRITGLALRTIQEMAARGEIPSAARIGRRKWSFDPVKIRAWVRAKEAQACQKTDISTRAARYSGDVSVLPDESIREAYELAIRGKPKSASRHGALS